MSKVLSNLIDFEKKQEEMLQKAEVNADKRSEERKKELLDQLNSEKNRLLKAKEDEIEKAEEKALKDSDSVKEDYIKKAQKLEYNFGKNHSQAVDKVFEEILENV